MRSADLVDAYAKGDPRCALRNEDVGMGSDPLPEAKWIRGL